MVPHHQWSPVVFTRWQFYWKCSPEGNFTENAHQMAILLEMLTRGQFCWKCSPEGNFTGNAHQMAVLQEMPTREHFTGNAHQRAILLEMLTRGQFYWKCSRYQSLEYVAKVHIETTAISFREQWVGQFNRALILSSAWWLLMPWHLFGARASATTMLTPAHYHTSITDSSPNNPTINHWHLISQSRQMINLHKTQTAKTNITDPVCQSIDIKNIHDTGNMIKW